jgi:hypothetical protein
MKRNTLLTTTSLLSILLLSFHLTQDALLEKRGTWPAGPGNLVAIAILLLFLCGTLLLAGRRSGYVITMLTGLFSTGMPVIHLTGNRFNPARHPDAFFFMWILIGLGVLGLFTMILATLEMRSSRRRDFSDATRLNNEAHQ